MNPRGSKKRANPLLNVSVEEAKDTVDNNCSADQGVTRV